MNNGKLIVLDGIDGCGKKTQADMLTGRLIAEGNPTHTTYFPNDENHIGGLIRECLAGKHGDFMAMDAKIVSILYAADRYESSKEIKQWLTLDYHVVIDRWQSANAIHQGGKISDKKERAQFLDWLKHLEFEIFRIPRPNLLFFLDIPLDLSVALMRERETRKGIALDVAEANIAHQESSLRNAREIVASDPSWIRIDCAENGKLRSREAVHEDIYGKVKQTFDLRERMLI